MCNDVGADVVLSVTSTYDCYSMETAVVSCHHNGVGADVVLSVTSTYYCYSMETTVVSCGMV